MEHAEHLASQKGLKLKKANGLVAREPHDCVLICIELYYNKLLEKGLMAKVKSEEGLARPYCLRVHDNVAGTVRFSVKCWSKIGIF